MKITRREFIGMCGSAALLSTGIGGSGYIEKMLNTSQKDDFLQTDLKFSVVGDPHVSADIDDKNISDRGNRRLEQVVNFINDLDTDFVVFIGDMADDGSRKSNDLVRDILKDLNKKYYVVAGNHDIIISDKIFERYYGPMERIEYINGYQLLFIGIEKIIKNDITHKWSFDFSKADKKAPTLVFVHGPVVDLPLECLHCQIKNKDVLEYAKDMKKELDKFTNLIGVYSGHIHYDSDYVIGGTRYVTVNGLNNFRFHDYFKVVNHSDKIGYSAIKGDKSYYTIMGYM